MSSNAIESFAVKQIVFDTTRVSSASGLVLLPGSIATAFAREMSRAILTIYQVVVKGYHE